MSDNPLLEYQIEDLTPRLKEVLRLIVRGYTNNDIARKLVIAPSTAENHVGQVLRKLGVSNRTEAAVLALRLRLLDEEDEEDEGDPS